MGYEKTKWADGQAPALSADNLNHLETQYDAATTDSKAYTDQEVAKKYALPSGGVPKSDLAAAPRTSLDKADSAVQPAALSAYVKTVNGNGPDASGNVVVPTGGGGGGGSVNSVNSVSPDGSGNVKLVASDVGAAPTTHTHTATQITDASTVGRSVLTAADAAAARTAIGAGTGTVKTVNGAAPDASGNVVIPKTLETSAAAEAPLYVYGDSIALGSNASSPTTRGWAKLLSNPNRLASVAYSNLAVSSTTLAQTVANVMTTAAVSATTNRGLHIIHSAINSIINVTSANDAAEKVGYVTALKAALRILRGSWLVATDSSISYTGTWATKAVAGTRSGSPRYSSTSGDKATITVNATEIAVMLLGFSTGAAAPGGVPFTMTVNGSAYTPEVSTTVAQTAPSAGAFAPMSIRVVNPNPGSSMTVVITRGTAAADFFVDGYVIKNATPPMVFVCPIIMPIQGVAGVSGLSVNGADTNRTPDNVTNFNNLITRVVSSAEFQDGMVQIVDISPGFVNASMRTTEAIHPNNIGHKVIAGNLEAAARALPFSTGLNL